MGFQLVLFQLALISINAIDFQLRGREPVLGPFLIIQTFNSPLNTVG